MKISLLHNILELYWRVSFFVWLRKSQTQRWWESECCLGTQKLFAVVWQIMQPILPANRILGLLVSEKQHVAIGLLDGNVPVAVRMQGISTGWGLQLQCMHCCSAFRLCLAAGLQLAESASALSCHQCSADVCTRMRSGTLEHRICVDK